jgi:hypothetical protein
MDREFVVKVVVGNPQAALDQGLYVPLLIRAATAASALSAFAERSSAGIIGPLDAESDSMASAVVGVEERAFKVVVCARQ